jgi:hypothetical protein
MSKIEVNQISSQCGSTLTIGQSGDTVTLAAGATSSGFGATYNGAVNWDTTAKTTNFTAVSGNGYFVNTTSGAITITLPATPSAGDIVAINDYARTFATNNVTVGRNGSNIQGASSDATISTNGQSVTFVYVDGTQGWMPTEDQTTGMYGNTFIVATGGTITTCGDYKIHTFTSPGTFCVSAGEGPVSVVDYLVVAGGGGGGGGIAGGGGAGGYRESHVTATSGCYTASPLASSTSLPVSVQGYPITVGAGGAISPTPNTSGNTGSNSIFSSITSAGGGGGSGPSSPTPGSNGGSGGGGSGAANPSNVGGQGNTPPVSPPQGNSGGTGAPSQPYRGAGGGGAGAVGSNYGPTAGPGGAGVTSSINATPTTRAGGGGGGGGAYGNPTGGTGGSGGGGGGKSYSPPSTFSGGGAGTANTGGGGGAGGGGEGCATGYAGGSGIVIIRYKYQ